MLRGKRALKSPELRVRAAKIWENLRRFKASQTLEAQIPGANQRADRMRGALVCLPERKPGKLQPVVKGKLTLLNDGEN